MIIENMSNEDYHKREEVSKSQLDLIAMSPSTFKQRKNLPPRGTDPFSVGSGAHAIILEPEVWKSDYIVGSTATTSTKANEKIAAENPGCTVLGTDDYQKVIDMQDSVMADPTARMIIENAQGAEISFFNKDDATGMGQRCRLDIDYRERGIIADLKFIDKIEHFQSSIHEYRYHVQDAHYRSVVAKEVGAEVDDLTFVFIVCGKTRNAGHYPVMVYSLMDKAVRIGRELRDRDMATYAERAESGNWIHIAEIDLPGWVKED